MYALEHSAGRMLNGVRLRTPSLRAAVPQGVLPEWESLGAHRPGVRCRGFAGVGRTSQTIATATCAAGLC